MEMIYVKAFPNTFMCFLDSFTLPQLLTLKLKTEEINEWEIEDNIFAIHNSKSLLCIKRRENLKQKDIEFPTEIIQVFSVYFFDKQNER